MTWQKRNTLLCNFCWRFFCFSSSKCKYCGLLDNPLQYFRLFIRIVINSLRFYQRVFEYIYIISQVIFAMFFPYFRKLNKSMRFELLLQTNIIPCKPWTPSIFIKLLNIHTYCELDKWIKKRKKWPSLIAYLYFYFMYIL